MCCIIGLTISSCTYFAAFVVQRLAIAILSGNLHMGPDLYPIGRPTIALFHIRSFPCLLVLLLKKKTSAYSYMSHKWIKSRLLSGSSGSTGVTPFSTLLPAIAYSYAQVAAFKSNLRPLQFDSFFPYLTHVYLLYTS